MGSIDDFLKKQMQLYSLFESERRLTEQIERAGVLEMQRQLADVANNSAIREAQRLLESSAMAEAGQRLDALTEALKPYSALQEVIEQNIENLRLPEMATGIERYRDMGLLPELEQHLKHRNILADELSNNDISHLIGMSKEREAIASTFRMPHLEEITGLSTKAFEMLNAEHGPMRFIYQDELQRLMDAIQTPWVDKTNALSSFESMARLSSVGNVLHDAPFDSGTSETLRSLLGDWSQVRLPQNIFSDYQARELFYRDHGFDQLLTVLPDPAFTDSLYETGILHPNLYPPVPSAEPSEQEADEDEQYWTKQRMLEAYDILFHLESFLREYLDETMTTQFGPDWVKRRVPGDIYQNWKRKRSEALDKGEKETRLLWYADFTDYLPIITWRDNWRDVFRLVFVNERDVWVSFNRLYPIRIPIAHARIITRDDFFLLTVEAHRILKAIGRPDEDED